MVGGNGRSVPFGLIDTVLFTPNGTNVQTLYNWLSNSRNVPNTRVAVLPGRSTLWAKRGNWKKLERDCSPTNLAEIEREFNSEVAIIVSKMTDDKSLPKAQRKKLQIVNAAKKKSDVACLIKLVDKSSNVAVT